MIDVFLDAARTSGLTTHLWDVIRPFIPTLFNQVSPRTVMLTAPHVPWYRELRNGNTVARWAMAASAPPYTDEIGQSIVDALLCIVSINSLQPQIPVGIWTWLNKQPSLPPVYFGQTIGTKQNVVCWVQELGDAEILKSYFLLIWLEWDCISSPAG